MGYKYSNRTITVGVKNVQKSWKKAKWSLNQRPSGLAPCALIITQPLPPLLLTVLYFCFINGFLSLMRPIVDTVKIVDLYQNILFFYCDNVADILHVATTNLIIPISAIPEKRS